MLPKTASITPTAAPIAANNHIVYRSSTSPPTVTTMTAGIEPNTRAPAQAPATPEETSRISLAPREDHRDLPESSTPIRARIAPASTRISNAGYPMSSRTFLHAAREFEDGRRNNQKAGTDVSPETTPPPTLRKTDRARSRLRTVTGTSGLDSHASSSEPTAPEKAAVRRAERDGVCQIPGLAPVANSRTVWIFELHSEVPVGIGRVLSLAHHIARS